MNHRVTSDSGNTVSLFPFLAVLLCTMGALLVLLVVLSQRAGERAAAEAKLADVEQAEIEKAIFEQSSDEDAAAVTKLVAQLEAAQQRQKQLKELRKQAAERLKAEQEKLTHLEEHTRRLEHELARMGVAAEQLKAAENEQSIDQQQAERELQRMQAMIAEKEKTIEELQEEAKGKRSYAIMPFYGEDGTTAQRIYIECSSKGVIIQPEGVEFVLSDFLADEWPGNPLAQVVRATQQYLQEKARQSGIPVGESLPLLIVRPDGTRAMGIARRALEAAEINFGFDFVGGNHSLTYPVAVDPLLAKTQNHARMNSRQDLSVHIAAAPRKYRQKLEAYGVTAEEIRSGRAVVGKTSSGRIGQAGIGNGGAASGYASAAGNRYGEGNGDAQFGMLAAENNGTIASTSQNGTDGESATAGSAGEGSGGEGGDSEGGDAAFGTESDGMAQGGSTGSTNGFGAQQQFAGAGGASSTNNMAALDSSSEGALATGVTSAGPTDTNRMVSGQFNHNSPKHQDGEQIGELNQKRPRNAVAIQRPIQIIVRKDQFALMPSRHVSVQDVNNVGTVVSMNQSPKQIGAELKVGLRQHMDQWGIAGQGLYWKPVLSLKVGPDGVETARRLAKMLATSGLEVRLPDELRVSQGGRTNATR